jgi:hypothetical protein
MKRRGFRMSLLLYLNPYHQEDILPVLKKKLIEYLKAKKRPKIQEMVSDLGLEFGSLTRKEKSCPVCGGDTYTLYKDLGGIDYYDNYWTVCVNPNCSWEGVHIEKYEPGPYI